MLLGMTPSVAIGVTAVDSDGLYQLLEITDAVYEDGTLSVTGKGIAVSDNITVALIVYTGVTNINDPAGTAAATPAIVNFSYADIKTSGNTKGSEFAISHDITAEAFADAGKVFVGIKTVNNPDVRDFAAVKAPVVLDANGDVDFNINTKDADTTEGSVTAVYVPVGNALSTYLPYKAGEVPARPHFTFAKWTDAEGKDVGTVPMTAEGITLYAAWTATTHYYVNFTAGEYGYLTGAVKIRVPHGAVWSDVIASLPTPTPYSSDYKFAYWTPEIPADDYTITSDLTYRAVFEPVSIETDTHITIDKAEYKDGYITVTGEFDAIAQENWDVAFRLYTNVNNPANPVTGNMLSHITVKVSDVVTDGNSFSYTVEADPANLKGNVYVGAKFVTVDVDESVYAPVTTTIKFTAGAGGYLGGTTEVSAPFGADFDTVVVPSPVANSGYSFLSWSPSFPETVDNSYTFTAIFNQDVVMPFDITSAIYDPATGKITVEGYAENARDQWHLTLMVYADVADADSVVNGKFVVANTFTYGDIKTTEAGYFKAEFDAYEDNLTGAVYAYGKYSAVASDPDAERVKTYLYFDKNASDAVDGATTETTVYIGDEIIPALTTDEPTRENYSFNGWAADAEGNDIAAGTVITAAGYTAYAKWEANMFTVSFTAGVGGSLEGAVSVEAQEGSSFANIVVPTPVAEDGYYFVGWTPSFPETVEGNLSFSAVFEKVAVMPFDITSAIYNPATGKITVEGYAENAKDAWNIALMVYADVANADSVIESSFVVANTFTYGDIKTAEAGYFKAELDAYEASLTGSVYVYGKYAAVVSEPDAERVKTYLYFDKNASDAVDGATTETTVYIGDEIIPALTTDYPTRDGYTFVGWYADADGNAIADGTLITAAGYTAYAKWISDEAEVTGYRFVEPKNLYLVNEPLASDYELYRLYADGTELPVDKSLYTVGAIPNTDAFTYAECLGWHTLSVYFDDAVYGNVYETSFDVFVMPDKLILEEESPLVRKEITNLDKDYKDSVLSKLTMDLIFNLKAKATVEELEAEFINEYFVNYFTTPDDIDVDVRIVAANGAEYTGQYVGTGARVQLVINGVVYDEVQVIVHGDVAGARTSDDEMVGDGIVNQNDTNLLTLYRNNKTTLTGINYIAGDVYSTADVNQSDINQIALYRNSNKATVLYSAWINASHEYSRDYTERFGNLVIFQ